MYYIHADHLNTPRLITDENNNIVWRNLPTTEPFGNSPVEEDPGGTGNRFVFNLRFPGQYADRETNTHYNRFRDYDPQIGRYMQSDPIGLAGGINAYTYVLGNPVSYVDSTGLDIWVEGPSGPEPSFHQSVNVGNPNAAYSSYSFGMNGNGLQGEVYRDGDLGGAIGAYKRTTLAQDAAFKVLMESKVGKTGIYGYDDICRSWSQRQFNNAPGVPTKPPVRVVFPQLRISPSSSRSTTGTSSTTGTWTSQ